MMSRHGDRHGHRDRRELADRDRLRDADLDRLSPVGTLVGRGDSLRAQGLVIGSGTGNLLVGWFFDGVLVETATVPLQNGTPTSVSNAISLPTLISVQSPHRAFGPRAEHALLAVRPDLRRGRAANAAARVAVGGGGLRTGPRSAHVLVDPGPGIARYGVGLRRRG